METRRRHGMGSNCRRGKKCVTTSESLFVVDVEVMGGGGDDDDERLGGGGIIHGDGFLLAREGLSKVHRDLFPLGLQQHTVS